jgi:hydrogenase large subunit
MGLSATLMPLPSRRSADVARTVLDPVTRAGGHLRLEFELGAGVIADVWASGMTFRGLELGLRGRDPRDAWLLAQRICGTCTGVHALASVRAVENALGITIPANARLIRNLLAGTMLVRDHVTDFYLSQLPDWVDVKVATTADPVATAALAASRSQRQGETAADFAKVRDRIAAELDNPHPGVWGNGWWGHPAYRLSPEQDLLLVSHMLAAVDWQREFMRIHTLLGGKDPHPQTYLVGGMAVAPPWGGPSGAAGRDHPQVPDHNAPQALSADGFAFIDDLLAKARDFVTQAFVPDIGLLVGAYPDYVALGEGPGGFLSAGEYPQDDQEHPSMLFPTGRLDEGNLELSQPVDNTEFLETVATSWYTYAAGGGMLLGGNVGETTPAWPGLALPLGSLEQAVGYSWVKAARYRGVAMEVGPLARVLVGVANGRAEIAQSLATQMAPLNLAVNRLGGAAGRLLARAVEADVVVRQAATWLADLRTNLGTGDVAVADITYWDPGSWPHDAQGFSLGEGPRGTVAHWVTIRDKVVADYQVIDASTWNLSPRDGSGNRGPIETALMSTPVSDARRPLEALRIVHSFAPCAGCAAHTFGPRRDAPVEVLARAVEALR